MTSSYKDEVVKVQDRAQLIIFTEQLAEPDLSYGKRLDTIERLRKLIGVE